MIKTTYICDRCSNEQATAEQFWAVGVWATHDGGYRDSAREHKKGIQVCRACLEALGFHVQTETKKHPEYVERTTEDILRELIEKVQS